MSALKITLADLEGISGDEDQRCLIELLDSHREYHPAHVRKLRESAEKWGELQPVLEDQHGHVIDGYYRLDARPGWHRQTVHVDNHAQALLLRLHANIEREPYPPAVRARIDRIVAALEDGSA
jgi:hypothetical protein